MRDRVASLLAFSFLLAVAGCTTAADAPKMSAAQIKATLVGSTQHGRSVDGDYVAYLAPDGTARFRGGATTLFGKYHITDDGQLCTAWQPKGPVEGCMTVAQTGSTFTFFLSNGVAYQTATLSSGNTDQL